MATVLDLFIITTFSRDINMDELHGDAQINGPPYYTYIRPSTEDLLMHERLRPSPTGSSSSVDTKGSSSATEFGTDTRINSLDYSEEETLVKQVYSGQDTFFYSLENDEQSRWLGEQPNMRKCRPEKSECLFAACRNLNKASERRHNDEHSARKEITTWSNSYRDNTHSDDRRPHSWYGERIGNSQSMRIFLSDSLRKMPTLNNIPGMFSIGRSKAKLNKEQFNSKGYNKASEETSRKCRYNGDQSRYKTTNCSSCVITANTKLPGYRTIRVFITYSVDEYTNRTCFVADIKNLFHSLRRSGVIVEYDMDPQTFATQRLNKHDWIDKRYKEANCIIACISPAYCLDVEEPNECQACPRTSQLNARYIYDKIRREYWNDQCRHKRVIPVIFKNSGATPKHVPDLMQSTFAYEYPEQADSVLHAVLGYGGYISHDMP